MARYMKARRATDPLFKLRCNLGSLLSMSLKSKGYSKKSKTQDLLGCPYTFLWLHLKYSAIRNYGSYDPNYGYEVDHIIPCSSATTEEELIKLQHFSNLQYLTPEDNASKKAKLDWSIGSSNEKATQIQHQLLKPECP